MLLFTILINHEHFPLETAVQEKIEKIEKRTHFNPTKMQAEEIMQRYIAHQADNAAKRGRSGSFAEKIAYRKAGQYFAGPKMGLCYSHHLYCFYCFKVFFGWRNTQWMPLIGSLPTYPVIAK